MGMTGRRRITGLIGIGVLAVVMAGCEEAEREEITSVEADAVAEVITSTTFDTWERTWVPGMDPAAMALDTYDYEVDCPEGGTIRAKGTIETSDDGSSLTQEGTLTFNDCGKETDDGETIVLTGTIADMFNAQFAGVGKLIVLDVDGSWAGSISWEIEDDGDSGVCDVDVALDATIEIDIATGEHDVTGSLTGTVCGVSVDDDDWSVEVK